jgi:hypothetical protein
MDPTLNAKRLSRRAIVYIRQSSPGRGNIRSVAISCRLHRLRLLKRSLRHARVLNNKGYACQTLRALR